MIRLYANAHVAVTVSAANLLHSVTNPVEVEQQDKDESCPSSTMP